MSEGSHNSLTGYIRAPPAIVALAEFKLNFGLWSTELSETVTGVVKLKVQIKHKLQGRVAGGT